MKNHCAKNMTIGQAYFFFDGRDGQDELVSHEKLIRSLILQLSTRRDGIHAALENLYSVECGNGLRQPSIASLEHTLMSIIESFDASYIFIDALDECCDRRKLLKWIKSITAGIPSKLHLMVSSRPEPDINIGLRSISNRVEIDIAGQKNTQDIGNYLDARLAEDDKWCDDIKRMIRSALFAGANGMQVPCRLNAIFRRLMYAS